MSSNAPAAARRVRPVNVAAADTAVRRASDGVCYLQSRHALEPYPRRLTERLEHWAARAGDRTFLAQRDDAGGWRTLTYAEALAAARRIGSALLERRLSAERPVVILSGNGIEHALIALAAMHCGVPYAPLATAYSLQSRDHATLRRIVDGLRPGLVFAAEGRGFERAIAAVLPPGAELVTSASAPEGMRATPFTALASTAATAAVDDAAAQVGPDTVAKILYTSGSTGRPKGVVNTQRMLCSNQAMLASVFPFLAEEPPVLCDWLPWNHTAGGNHNLGLVLNHGGTLHIDEGKPVPGLIEKTVRNLRDIAPTIYFNVPRGYEALLPFLREDAALRKTFFSRLGLLQYAAAVLPQPVLQAYEELAIQACGERVLWITGYGATETAPAAMFTSRGALRAGSVGLPVDGLEMKLAPVADKLEARFRGPSGQPLGLNCNPALIRRSGESAPNIGSSRTQICTRRCFTSTRM